MLSLAESLFLILLGTSQSHGIISAILNVRQTIAAPEMHRRRAFSARVAPFPTVACGLLSRRPIRSLRDGGATQAGNQAVERIVAGKVDLQGTVVTHTDLDRNGGREQV